MAKRAKKKPPKATRVAKKAVTADTLFEHVELKFIRLLELKTKLRIANRDIPKFANVSMEANAGPSSEGDAINANVSVKVIGYPEGGSVEDNPESSRLTFDIHYQCGFTIIDATAEEIKPHAQALVDQAILMVWPNIRETVQSLSAKMSIPSLTIPMILRGVTTGTARNMTIGPK